MSKRLLMCIPTMEGGGAEGQVVRLATGLSVLGWEVHVALIRGGVNLPALAASASAVHFLRYRRAYDPRLPMDLARLILRVRPDVIHTWLPMMDISGGALASVLRVPWIATERSTSDAYEPGLGARLRRLLVPRADFVVANSEAGAEYLVEMGCRPDSVQQIPNAVDGRVCADVTAEDGGAPDVVARSPLLLFAGRLISSKDIPTVLRGFAAVSLVREDVTAELWGAGPLERYCREWIARHLLENSITVRGYRTDLVDSLCSAGVLVSASRYEGQPNAVLEAMAVGCPLVLSRIPSHVEVAGDAALYFEVGDASGMRDAVLETLRDVAETQERSGAARLRTLAHTVPAISLRYTAVYEAAARP